MSLVPIYTQVAQERYRKSVQQVAFSVNPRTEPEVYEKLHKLPERAAYIKGLVYQDLGFELENVDE